MLTAPVSFVLLPHFSKSVSIGQIEYAAFQLSCILESTVTFSLLGSLISLGTLQVLMKLWLGSEFTTYTSLIISTSLMIPGFLLLEILRGPLDAVSRIPLNAFSYGGGAVAICLLFFGTQYLFDLSSAAACAISLSFGYSIAGSISVILAKRFYGLGLSFKRYYLLVLIWGFGFSFLLIGNFLNMTAIFKLIFSLIVAVFYIAALVFIRPIWFEQIIAMAAKKTEHK
jgi:hypothetical protein